MAGRDQAVDQRFIFGIELVIECAEIVVPLRLGIARPSPAPISSQRSFGPRFANERLSSEGRVVKLQKRCSAVGATKPRVVKINPSRPRLAEAHSRKTAPVITSAEASTIAICSAPEAISYL